MATIPIQVGSVVLSRRGRDKGNYFVCVGVSEREVLVADGELHKLKKPKRKNIIHVKPNGIVLENIRQKLLENKKVFDSELKKQLRPFKQPDITGETEETDV